MAAIFANQDVALGGVFQANRCKLNFGDNGVTGVLVQAMQFSFSQNITRLYEIGDSHNATGKSNVYYVTGRCQGQMQLNRVIGPAATIETMYTVYGDACQACENNMTLSLTETDCSTCGNYGAGMYYTLQYCVLTQVGVSVQAQDMILNETCQIMFSGLDAGHTS